MKLKKKIFTLNQVNLELHLSLFELSPHVFLQYISHAKRMETSDTEKYLGDLISSDGSNKKNIQARKEKVIGIVSQIMGILEGTIYGPYYFEVGLILRSSLLVNSIF